MEDKSESTSVCSRLFQSCVVGVAVPDPETFRKWCKQRLDIEGEISELCNKPVSCCNDHICLPYVFRISELCLMHFLSFQEVKKAVLRELTDLGKEAGLVSFEQVSRDFRKLYRG